MADQRRMTRLSLPQVTLFAATSINVAATINALQQSMAAIDFAACMLFTDADVIPDDPRISTVRIPRLTSGADYSHFLLSDLLDYLETTHCMIVQWDGHVLDAMRWQDAFLDYDYIGASWPQFDHGHDVGNGGFSIRSRRLLEKCRMAEFRASHPEDVAICRINRTWLEGHGASFAPRTLADAFSAERAGALDQTFGYHGVWHMPRALGTDEFWEIYSGLDDCSIMKRDLWSLLSDIAPGRRGIRRSIQMCIDVMLHRKTLSKD